MKNTCTCPPTDELKQLLVNDLSGERAQACTDHMDSCTDCQRKLEEIATGGTNLSKVVENLSESEPQATSAYWPALRQIGAETQQAVATPPPTKARDKSLGFLQPATDAAYLGRIGHFDVMRVLGRGGMGVVLEAFDSKLQRHVAIKVLDTDLSTDETNRQRFCREARAAASINHENVVSVYQVDRMEESGLPYMVMQLIVGETLEQRLAREKRLPVKDVVRIGMQAARGLAAAHAQGLIHRDIKPGNIMLEEPGGRVKLTDFGLARVTEDVKLTRTGYVSGTPLYMSPEQALGEEADQRSDLFSLGAIFYEMLGGQTPFYGSSPLVILRQITESKHLPLRELDADVPEILAEMVDELLAKKPDDRYQTANDLAEVLEFMWAQMSNKSLELPAVCQIEVRRRSTRFRTMLAVVGAGLLTLGLLGGMAVSRYFAPAASSAPAAVVSAGEPVAVLSANAGTVWSVAFNPASDTVAMGVEDGTVRLWDLPTKTVKATLSGHRGVVWASQFSSDGKVLATAGDDGLLKLWQPPSAEPLQIFEHPNAVRGLAMSRDGSLLYAGDRKGGLRVWSAGSDHPLRQAEQPGAVYSVALSPNGKTLASAGSDSIVRLWNADTLSLKLTLSGHAGPVYALSFNNDGTRLASAGWDKTLRTWDVGTGLLAKSWEAGNSDIWAVTYAPDGQRLATAGQDGAVQLWDPNTGELQATYLGHKAAIHTLAFNADGSLLASGGRDGAARIWNVQP